MSSQWQAIPLGEICQIDIGGTPSRSEESYWWKSQEDGERFPWVSISDMKERVINDTKESITRLGKEKSNVKHITKGTLLMSFKLTVGRLAFAGTDLFTNEAIAALRTTEIIDRDFLYYGLQYWNLMDDTDQAVKGVTLNKQKLQEIICTLPPLPEQQKIAEILSGIDRCIDSIASKVKKCENILQGIFVELDQIENQGQTARLGEVVTIQNGYAFQSRMFTEEKDSIPLIRISDIQYGFVNLSKSKKIPANFSISDDYRIHKGDILIAMSGATTGKIGVSCSETICLLNQRVGKFSFQGSDVTNEFVSQLLLSGYLEHRLLAAAAGGAQPNISGQGIEALEIPLPDESRQSNLSRIISSVRNLIASENKVTAKHLHLKDSLSSDLLSGRKRVSI